MRRFTLGLLWNPATMIFQRGTVHARQRDDQKILYTLCSIPTIHNTFTVFPDLRLRTWIYL